MNHRRQLTLIVFLLFFFAGLPVIRAQEQNQALYSDIPIIESKLHTNLNDSEMTVDYMKVINYYNGTDNDSAVIYAMQGLQWFKERKFKVGQARMVLALGNYDDTHGNSASASEKVQYALSLFKEAKHKPGVADADNIMGVVEAKKGNFDKAISYFIDAQKIYISVDNKKGLFSTWMNLGLLYDFISDSAKLFTYYGKADSLSQYLPLSDNIIGLYNNLGASYFEHHDTAKGYSYITKALKLSEKPDYVVSHIVCVMSLGEIMFSSGRKKEGENQLRQALTLARQHHLPDQEAGVFINLVMLSHGENKNLSISYLDTALALVKSTGNKPRQLEVYRAFATLYESEKNYEESNKYLKLQHALSDSLLNINKSKEIANTAAVYDLQLSNAKVSELEVLIKKNKAQKNTIIGIIALLIVLCSVLYYFLTVVYRYYRETKKLNHNLEVSKQELARLNNMKDKLFSVIGHDLRGPMANIPVIINIIQAEDAIQEPFRDILSTVKEQAEATVDTLDKLLLLGKSVMRGETINPVNFDPKPFITKNIELLSLSANNKEINIEDHTVPGLSVYADSGHFDFIIRNLLSNAVKFSFKGGRIEISAKNDSKPGFILFTVKDYGAGINETALPQMFKSMVTSTYGTANEKGTGIGLMLCEEFVTLNGGYISVESKEGGGTTFTFSLKRGG